MIQKTICAVKLVANKNKCRAYNNLVIQYWFKFKEDLHLLTKYFSKVTSVTRVEFCYR